MVGVQETGTQAAAAAVRRAHRGHRPGDGRHRRQRLRPVRHPGRHLRRSCAPPTRRGSPCQDRLSAGGSDRLTRELRQIRGHVAADRRRHPGPGAARHGGGRRLPADRARRTAPARTCCRWPTGDYAYARRISQGLADAVRQGARKADALRRRLRRPARATTSAPRTRGSTARRPTPPGPWPSTRSPRSRRPSPSWCCARSARPRPAPGVGGRRRRELLPIRRRRTASRRSLADPWGRVASRSGHPAAPLDVPSPRPGLRAVGAGPPHRACRGTPEEESVARRGQRQPGARRTAPRNQRRGRDSTTRASSRCSPAPCARSRPPSSAAR